MIHAGNVGQCEPMQHMVRHADHVDRTNQHNISRYTLTTWTQCTDAIYGDTCRECGQYDLIQYIVIYAENVDNMI
jgi:hypothetical protein